MIVGIDDEEQGLEVVNLEAPIDGPFELDGIALNLRRLDGVRDLAIGTEEAAPVDLEVVILTTHPAQLDSERER